MDIHAIRTEDDCRAALRELPAGFDNEPEPGTGEGDRFDLPATLVAAYEARHVPVSSPDPIEVMRFRMEQAGLSAAHRRGACVAGVARLQRAAGTVRREDHAR